jgi:hypothetical protein
MEIGYYKKLGEPWASHKDKKYLGQTRAILKRETNKIITEETTPEPWETGYLEEVGDKIIWVERKH